MAWTTIPNGDVDADSPITTSLMTALRDNPEAIANGDSGAPEIQTAAYAAASVDQTALGANSVGQSEVKTTYQTITGTFGITNFEATGGDYVIGHTCQTENSDRHILVRGVDTAHSYGDNTGHNHRWYKDNEGTGTSRDEFRLHYINTSPPYDMGDGDIPLFAYAVVDNATKDIEMMSISPDPIWLYNGPTNCRADRKEKIRNHKGEIIGVRHLRKRRDMSGHPLTLEQAKAAGRAEYKAYMRAFRNAATIYEEITPAMKHADMDLVPHPFLGNDLSGKTPIMLDPVADDLRDLLEFRDHDVGGGDSQIVRDYFKIGNQALPRVGPTGLMIVSASWK